GRAAFGFADGQRFTIDLERRYVGAREFAHEGDDVRFRAFFVAGAAGDQHVAFADRFQFLQRRLHFFGGRALGAFGGGFAPEAPVGRAAGRGDGDDLHLVDEADQYVVGLGVEFGVRGEGAVFDHAGGDGGRKRRLGHLALKLDFAAPVQANRRAVGQDPGPRGDS